jgi:hypothetical protein
MNVNLLDTYFFKLARRHLTSRLVFNPSDLVIIPKYLSESLFGPYRSHFLSRKSLIAAKNETKEKRWKEEEETLNSTCEQASKHPCLRVNEATAA